MLYIFFSEGLLPIAHLKLKQKWISRRILNRLFSHLTGSLGPNRHQASRSPPPPPPPPAQYLSCLRRQVRDWKSGLECGLLREDQ